MSQLNNSADQVLKENGWGPSLSEFGGPEEAGLIVYISDFRFHSIDVFCIRKSYFDSFDVVADAGNAAEGVAEICKNMFPTDSIDPAIFPALTEYVKSCESMKAWNQTFGSDVRLHVVLNIYAPVSNNVAMMRPVFLSWPEGPVINAEAVKEFITSAYYKDSTIHPEWFVTES